MKAKVMLMGEKGTCIKMLVIILILFLFPLLGSVQAATYYVDPSCDSLTDPLCCKPHTCFELINGNAFFHGTSPDDPLCSINDALLVAEEGSTIYVASGEYDNLSISKNGIKLISRDCEGNQDWENTIISGYCNNPDIGTSTSVVLVSAQNVEIHGFTITMRPSNAFFPPFCSVGSCWNGAVQSCWDGGGCPDSITSPLDHAACCWLWFPPGRAGIYAAADSSVTLENCSIRDNYGTRAGGIFCDNCSLTVRNSTIKGNHAGPYGAGAIATWKGSLTLINTVISDNGGCWSGGIAAIYSTDFFQNLDKKNSISLLNSTIANNNGGIALPYTDSLVIENSIVWWNSDKQFYIHDETYNEAYQYDQSYLYMQGPVSPMPPQYYQYNMHFPNRFNINITNSDIQTTNFIDYRLFRTQDATNINVDPEFIDKDNPQIDQRNYYLDRSSPCIDTGNNNAPGLPDKDLDGHPRITDGNLLSDGSCDGIAVVDMGADEVGACDPNLLVANFEVDRPAGTLKVNPFARIQVLEPLTVQFTDTSTGNVTSWLWDFGDGGTSTEQNPSHEYWGPISDIWGGAKDHTVTLTVSDGVNSDTRTVNYGIHLTNLPSIIEIYPEGDVHPGDDIHIVGYDFDDDMNTSVYGEIIYHPGDQTHLCDVHRFEEEFSNTPCSPPAQRSVTIGEITYPLGDPDSPIINWYNNQVDVKIPKACSWFGCQTSITKDVSVKVNKYYDSNKVTLPLNRTGCIPDIPCTLVPDNPVVHQGGILGIQATVTNNDCLSQTFKFATYAIKPGGNRYPASGWLYGPVSVTLDAGASQSTHISHNIPSTATLGTYTYYGNVGVPPNTLYNSCQFNFTVIP